MKYEGLSLSAAALQIFGWALLIAGAGNGVFLLFSDNDVIGAILSLAAGIMAGLLCFVIAGISNVLIGIEHNTRRKPQQGEKQK
jgi:hypothetical protein